jgi:hypothetical protein
MNDRPPLVEAEVIARAVGPLNPWADVVMDEYDRRGRIEQAAILAAEVWRAHPELRGWISAHFPELAAAMGALAGTVGAST